MGGASGGDKERGIPAEYLYYIGASGAGPKGTDGRPDNYGGLGEIISPRKNDLS